MSAICAAPAWVLPSSIAATKATSLKRRISSLAATDPGIHFVSLADMVPPGDRSYHAFDMIHPSLKGSHAIAQRVGRVIAR